MIALVLKYYGQGSLDATSQCPPVPGHLGRDLPDVARHRQDTVKY